MPDPDLIKTVALVHLADSRLLLVRPTGKDAFYMPGGKLEAAEDALAALHREIGEELGTSIVAGSVRPYGVFEERAYGLPAPTRVRIDCYVGELDSRPTASAEIAELMYFGRSEYLAMPDTAPAVRVIVADLHARRLIR